MVALLLHAAGCFVPTTAINKTDPALASIDDERRVQCLEYNSLRYVVVGVFLCVVNLIYGVERSWITAIITIVIPPEGPGTF
jgi:hypothetical protein